jgi:hypothetical protein
MRKPMRVDSPQNGMLPPIDPSPGELLAQSFHEMLEGYRLLYDRIGDLSIKDVIERAERALAANQ